VPGSVIQSAIASGIIGALGLYKRLISPLLPSACRFHPTCSVYMRVAVLKYGAGKGVWMGLKRLGRCHPFHPGGNDPV
jgi:putative membrane protein insertion efficiency factor